MTSVRERAPRGIYQGWLGCRNLGDEALFVACVRSLPRIRWEPLPFQETGASSRALASLKAAWLPRAAARPPAPLAILGGGTILNRADHWLDQYRQLRRMVSAPVPVFSPGVADPRFWSRVRGWRDTRAQWREALADLPEIGVRGPFSKRLLEESGVCNVIVAGDPALAFHTPGRPAPVPGRRAVAMNVGRTGGLMWGSEDRAIAALADAASRLRRAGFRVQLFPMWHGDRAVCREVAAAAGLQDQAVAPLVLDPDVFLRYLEGFDVVVSLKLHAAVFAAAAGVPFIAIEHQPKVRDFTESLGWGRFTWRTDGFDGSDIERAVHVAYDDLPALRLELAARVESLAQVFRSYARRVEDFLLALRHIARAR